MSKISNLIRQNIRNLKPYSSARDEFSESSAVLLDANENSFGSVLKENWNRYPDPHQKLLKDKIAILKKINAENIFLGNGSDEAIDLIIRLFCEPGYEKILTIDPTYGMYQVAAGINNIETIKIRLNQDFQLNPQLLLETADNKTKIIFLCSPNNPNGHILDKKAIVEVVENFPGIVVLDEAYIDFIREASLLNYISKYENLIVLQTFSKAWGLAGIRLGMAFAQPEITAYLEKIKYPYNVNEVTQKLALEALNHKKEFEINVSNILKQREYLQSKLFELSVVENVFTSSANFLLVRFKKSTEVYQKLINQGIVVRDRSRLLHCDNCLRITVGTAAENEKLIAILRSI